MTHQRPIPEDQTSPYPLQPEPITADAPADTVKQKQARAQAKADAADASPETTEGKTGLSNTVLTVGAAIGVTAAAPRQHPRRTLPPPSRARHGPSSPPQPNRLRRKPTARKRL